MHKVNFKNILIGLGSATIIIVSLYVGLYSGASNFNDQNQFDNYISESTFNDGNICGLVNTYKSTDKRNFSGDIRTVNFDNVGNMYISEKSWFNVRMADGTWRGLYDDQLVNIRDFFIEGDYIYLLDETEDKKGLPIVVLKKYLVDLTKNPPTMTLVEEKITGGSTIAYSKKSGYIFIGTWLGKHYKKLRISDLSLVSTVDTTISFDKNDASIIKLTVGLDNNLYVLDDRNNVVKIFNVENDNFITHFGQDGLGVDALRAIIGITVAPNGDVYITESIGNIKKFTKDINGKYVLAGIIEVFGFNDSDENEILRIVFGPNGNLFVIRGHFPSNKEGEYYAVQEFTPPCLKLTIKKETTPKNPQIFNFSADFFGINNPNFTLFDDGKGNNFKEFVIFKIPSSVSEQINKCYVLKEIKCVDETGNPASGFSYANNILNVSPILSNQKVSCTFVNIRKDIRDPVCNTAVGEKFNDLNP